ncbi:MAG: hypothetical protein ISS48_03285 [Candidatus Aenigmarchaeota archaeon]|nr:hypothetical protein [Candidatus Aenigmarchaeota archaeon]
MFSEVFVWLWSVFLAIVILTSLFSIIMLELKLAGDEILDFLGVFYPESDY